MSTLRQTSRPCRGFTIIEATFCVLLVGVTLAAALQASAAANLTQFNASQKATARFLAQGLMSEILTLNYQDPGAAPIFGREGLELLTSRANYNDVDDYVVYTEMPPTDRDGNVIPNLANWSRSVAVVWVTTANVSTVSATETGLKRITVTAKFKGNPVITLTALKSNAP